MPLQRRRLFPGLSLLLGAVCTLGCTSIFDPPPAPQEARRTVVAAKGATISLVGRIDMQTASGMIDAMRREGGIQKVYLNINSTGGSGQAALMLAQFLEPMDTEIRVSGECSSACLQFVLPVADRIVLTGPTVMVAHRDPIYWLGVLDRAGEPIVPEFLAFAEAAHALYLRRGVDLGILDCASELEFGFGPIGRAIRTPTHPTESDFGGYTQSTRNAGLQLDRRQLRTFISLQTEIQSLEMLVEQPASELVVVYPTCPSERSETYQRGLSIVAGATSESD